MFEQLRRTALVAMCLPALAGEKASADVAFEPQASALTAKLPTIPREEPVLTTATFAASEFDSRVLVPAAGLAMVIAGIGLHHSLRKHRRSNEKLEALVEFDQFTAELEQFNELHTRISGHTASQAARKGRAADFPELPHDYAFEKAWGPLLHSVGVAIKMRDESLGSNIMHGRFELLIVDISKVCAFLKLYSGRMKAQEVRHEPAVSLLARSAEEYILSYLEQHANTRAMGDLPSKMSDLSQALNACGPMAEADRVDFFRGIYYGHGQTLVEYAHFHAACKNQTEQDGEYYIFPADFARAVKHAKTVIHQAAGDVTLVPLGHRIINELRQRTEALLQYTYTAADEDRPDGEESGSGGCAVATEQEAPKRDFDKHDPQVLRAALKLADDSRSKLEAAALEFSRSLQCI